LCFLVRAQRMRPKEGCRAGGDEWENRRCHSDAYRSSRLPVLVLVPVPYLAKSRCRYRYSTGMTDSLRVSGTANKSLPRAPDVSYVGAYQQVLEEQAQGMTIVQVEPIVSTVG
jgi:hypothetical protein